MTRTELKKWHLINDDAKCDKCGSYGSTYSKSVDPHIMEDHGQLCCKCAKIEIEQAN